MLVRPSSRRRPRRRTLPCRRRRPSRLESLRRRPARPCRRSPSRHPRRRRRGAPPEPPSYPPAERSTSGTSLEYIFDADACAEDGFFRDLIDPTNEARIIDKGPHARCEKSGSGAAGVWHGTDCTWWRDIRPYQRYTSDLAGVSQPWGDVAHMYLNWNDMQNDAALEWTYLPQVSPSPPPPSDPQPRRLRPARRCRPRCRRARQARGSPRTSPTPGRERCLHMDHGVGCRPVGRRPHAARRPCRPSTMPPSSRSTATRPRRTAGCTSLAPTTSTAMRVAAATWCPVRWPLWWWSWHWPTVPKHRDRILLPDVGGGTRCVHVMVLGVLLCHPFHASADPAVGQWNPRAPSSPNGGGWCSIARLDSCIRWGTDSWGNSGYCLRGLGIRVPRC